MHIRKISTHIHLHVSGIAAYILSSEIESLEWQRLPTEVANVIFEVDSVNPEVLLKIPMTVKNVMFTKVTNIPIKLDLLPPHLEVFMNGKKIRSGDTLIVKPRRYWPWPREENKLETKKRKPDSMHVRKGATKCIKTFLDSKDGDTEMSEIASDSECNQNRMRK